MTIGTDVLSAILVLVSVAAFTLDARHRRIPNALTFPAMAAGLALSAVLLGAGALAQSLLGILTGFVLFIWLYALKVMGAGDVKLLMAYGALGGAYYALDVAILSVLLGGVYALVSLVMQKRFGDFWNRMQLQVLAIRHKGLNLPRPGLDATLKMPFGIMLAIAAVWTRFGAPLDRWGLKPW